MSIKTLRKRIALVAVSALGAGLLSVVAVPTANAAAGDIASIGGIGILGSNTTNTGTTQTATILTTGSLTVTSTAHTGYFVVSAGGKITTGSDTRNISADQQKYTATSGSAEYFTITPVGAAGSTFTVTGYTSSTSGVVQDILTVTIAATSDYGVANASKSYASWVATSTATAIADVANANTTTYSTNALYLNVQLNDAYGNDITGTTGALMATVTEGALVTWGTAATPGTPDAPSAANATYSTAVSNADPRSVNLLIKQKTAGAGWNGTVTVTYNGVVIATKSGKITGAPAKLEVSPYKINRPNATPNTNWLYYVKDVAGNELSVTATDVVLSTSSDASVISAAVGSVAPSPTADSDTYGVGTSTCQKAGSSKVVMQITTNGNVVKSNEMTILCGGAAYSYTASFDKASYVQGEIATLTVTFKDAAGNLANSFQQVDTCSGTPSSSPVTDAVISAPMMSPVGSASLFTYSTSTSTCGIYVGSAGTKKYTFTVGTSTGLTDGSYNAVVNFPTVDVATSVAYKVSTGAAVGVSNAEVLAAIVKLIASINKQIRALQKSLRR